MVTDPPRDESEGKNHRKDHNTTSPAAAAAADSTATEDTFTKALEARYSESKLEGVVTSDRNGLCVGAKGTMNFENAAAHILDVRLKAENLVGDKEDIRIEIQTAQRSITVFKKDKFTFGVASKNS
eukprot:CAMPEP_0185276758 /NCGR_PEP_ID=MMETSP1359-20130426/56923_1 /TAXON_ID=552665 /ORGANISM="Bigelowiella longifila, Strain CCMP242" /LENGTH=125 /DNA_ID=CAMNT_0027870559 /DNA_START=164 /DNA_END=541 /DNA_ORIENTATION=-